MATRLNITSSVSHVNLFHEERETQENCVYQPLRLLKSSVSVEEGMQLDLSRPLSEQVEDGSDLLVLER